MKKKISKGLSIFLALMMILTSMPLIAMPALGADCPHATTQWIFDNIHDNMALICTACNECIRTDVGYITELKLSEYDNQLVEQGYYIVKEFRVYENVNSDGRYSTKYFNIDGKENDNWVYLGYKRSIDGTNAITGLMASKNTNPIQGWTLQQNFDINPNGYVTYLYYQKGGDSPLTAIVGYEHVDAYDENGPKGLMPDFLTRYIPVCFADETRSYNGIKKAADLNDGTQTDYVSLGYTVDDNYCAHELTTTKTTFSCIDGGVTEVRCIACGELISSTPIPATGQHSYGVWVDFENNEHHRRECTVCNALDYELHDFQVISTDPAGCTTPGINHSKCTTCTATKDDNIPAAGHKFDNYFVDEANYPGQHCKKCTVCEELDNNFEDHVFTFAPVEGYGKENRQHTGTCVCGATKTVACTDVTEYPVTVTEADGVYSISDAMFKCNDCHGTYNVSQSDMADEYNEVTDAAEAIFADAENGKFDSTKDEYKAIVDKYNELIAKTPALAGDIQAAIDALRDALTDFTNAGDATLKSYNVSFTDTDNATLLPQKTVLYGKTITFEAPSARPGYTFKGWTSQDYEGNVYAVGEEFEVKSDIVFTAHYEANEYTCELKGISGVNTPSGSIFYTFGIETVAANEFADGVKAFLANEGIVTKRNTDNEGNPSATWYDITGWKLIRDGVEVPYGDNIYEVVEDGDVFVAIYESNGEPTECDLSEYNAAVANIEALIAQDDMYDSEKLQEMLDEVKLPSTDNLTYADQADVKKATKAIKNFNLPVKVTVDNANGDVVYAVEGKFVNDVLDLSKLAVPTRAGYTFKGWKANGESATTVTLLKNTSIVAVWEGKEYVVEFAFKTTNDLLDFMGAAKEVTATRTYTFGDAGAQADLEEYAALIIAGNDEYKEGDYDYTFAAWKAFDVTVPGDKIVNATYTQSEKIIADYDDFFDAVDEAHEWLDKDITDDVRQKLQDLTEKPRDTTDQDLGRTNQDTVDEATKALRDYLDSLKDSEEQGGEDIFNVYEGKFNAYGEEVGSYKGVKGKAITAPTVIGAKREHESDVFNGWNPTFNNKIEGNTDYTATFTTLDYSKYDELIDLIGNTDIRDDLLDDIAAVTDPIDNDRDIDNSNAEDKNTQEKIDAAIDALKEILGMDEDDTEIPDTAKNKYTVKFNVKNAEDAGIVVERADLVKGASIVKPTAADGMAKDYMAGDERVVFIGWDAEVPELVEDNAEFTALYTRTFVPADYTAYNAAEKRADKIIAENDLTDEVKARIDELENACFKENGEKFGITDQGTLNDAVDALNDYLDSLFDEDGKIKEEFLKHYDVAYITKSVVGGVVVNNAPIVKSLVKGASVKDNAPTVPSYVYRGFESEFTGEWTPADSTVSGAATYTAVYTQARNMDDVVDAIDRAEDLIKDKEVFTEDKNEIEEKLNDLLDYLEENDVVIDENGEVINNPIGEKDEKKDAEIKALIDALNEACGNAERNKNEQKKKLSFFDKLLNWFSRLIILIKHFLGLV